MDISIRFRQNKIQGDVTLPASKSISNRALLIHALAGGDKPVENFSDCDDTRSMLEVLASNGSCFNIGHAGTAMRFLTAFLARIVGKWEITGSERMKQRPIGVLVDALNELGARIEYVEKEGFPPLRIYGSLLKGGEIQIAASVSSQYISALMMIAPYMLNGLKLHLTGRIVSLAYIKMTASIMKDFGADVEIHDTTICIAPRPYTSVPYRVEADWSAASYFFELLAVAGSGELTLSGLKKESIQGDAAQVKVWEKMGIKTSFEEDKVRLSRTVVENGKLEMDFVNMPDLVQSFVVACCLMDKPFVFSGVETLRIKETDRIAALVTEMAKLGYKLETMGDKQLIWDGSRCPSQRKEIETYQDHRMAMAFAPAALLIPDLVIKNKEVVSKSFPAYWDELTKLGMEIK